MISALFSVMLLAAETATAVPATAPPPSPEAEAPKEEKKICKREEATESRLGSKRVCLTAEQWRARQTAGNGLRDVGK